MPQNKTPGALDFDTWAAGLKSNPDYAGYTDGELRQAWDTHYGLTNTSDKPAKTPGIASDAKNLLGVGTDTLAQGLRWGVGKVFGDNVVNFIDRLGGTSGEKMEEVKQGRIAALSEPMRAAREKEFVTEDRDGNYGVGPAWSDPRSYYSAIIESLPGTLSTMAPSLLIGKAIAARAMTKAIEAGASKEAAEALAAKTFQTAAQVAGSVLEGSQQGMQSGMETEQRVLQMPDEVLAKSDFYQDLLRSGMDPVQAKKTLASNVGVRAALLSGVATSVFAGQGDRVLAKVFSEGMTGKLPTRIAKTTLGEGLLEEFPQGVVSKIGENAALQRADPTIRLKQGAANEGVSGMVAGLGMGAGFGAMSRQEQPGHEAAMDLAAEQARVAIGQKAADDLAARDAVEKQHTQAKVDAIMSAGSIEEAIAAATSELPAVLRTGANLPDGVQAPVSSIAEPLGGDIETPAFARAGRDIPGVEPLAQPAINSVADQAGVEPAAADVVVPASGSTPARAGQLFLQTLKRVSPRAFEAAISATANITGAQDLESIGSAFEANKLNPQFWQSLVRAAGSEASTLRAAAFQAMQVASRQAPELQPALIHIKDAATNADTNTIPSKREALIRDYDAGKIALRELSDQQDILDRQQQKYEGTPRGEPSGRLQDVAFRDEEAAQGAAKTLGVEGAAAVETPRGATLRPVDATADGRAVEALKASIRGDSQAASTEAAASGAIESLRAVPDANLPGIALARAFAEKMGRRVVVVDSEGDTAPFNGATVNRGQEGDAKGVLFLHAKTKRPALAVIGHELMHTLSPELRAKLAKALGPMIGEAKIEAKMKLGLSREAALEEVLADIVGNRFMEASFWKFLERRDAGLFRDFAQRVLKLLDRIVEAMKSGLGLFGADEGISSSKLRRARVMIADILAEHAQSLAPEERQKLLGYNGEGGYAANNVAPLLELPRSQRDEPAARVAGRAPVEPAKREEPKQIGYEPGNRANFPIEMGDGKERNGDEPQARVVGRAPVEAPAPQEPKRLGYDPTPRAQGEPIAVKQEVADEPPAKVIGRAPIRVTETDHAPTDGQKEAGNYKKGEVLDANGNKFEGLDIKVENKAGSTREGKDKNGKPWSVDMTAHYGYIRRTEGADGDQIDVYVVPRPVMGAPVFVFDQYNPSNGRFDEHKAVLGAGSRQEAESVYDAHFSDGSGPKRRKGLRQMTLAEFKEWIKNGDTKKPVGVKGGVTYSTESERDGDGAGRDSSRGAAPLAGAPDVAGAAGPDPRLVEVAQRYARDAGIPFVRQARYVEVDEARARRIADAYDAMEHAPQDPRVKEAYENLIRQTTAQYRALEKAGYKFWFFDETNDPYQGNPWNAMRDLRANKRMGVFATEAGFGSGATDLNVDDNPLLADTGIEWPYGSPDGEMKRVLANDLFRAVHDAFGHGIEGAGFRARGEENAWQAHARMFTGSALGALTSETRGQNSWLNFGPYGEKNQTAKVEDTTFADQKTGLMPEWTWTEGRVEDEAGEDRGPVRYSIEQKDIERLGPVGRSLLQQKKGWAIMTAENPDAQQATPEENERAMAALKRDLDEQGLKYVPVRGKYGNEEQSLLIVGDIDAAEMARKYRQEAVLTPQGFVYQDGWVRPAKGVEFFDSKPDDFFTEVPGGVYFAMDIDWDAKRPGESTQYSREGRGFNSREIQVGGKWRPIENSDGKPVANGFKEQGAFWRWFGDSKVVDAEGRPLVVYHGTAQNLVGDAFNQDMARSEGGAFYFSHSPLFKNPATNANEYAKGRAGEAPQVMPVYLSLKNPMVTGFTEPMPQGDKEIGDWLGRMNAWNRARDRDKEQFYKKAIREAQQGGHDGVIIRNVEDVPNDAGRRFTDEADVYIAFRPEQIKSATGNRGTFDSSNPDITYSSESPTGIELTRAQRAASLEQDLYRDFELRNMPKFKNQAEFGEFLNKRLGRDTFAGNYGPQALKHVAGLLAHEGILAARQRKNAGSWYRDSIEAAMAEAARMYPEIGSGTDARFLFSVALAITSNGQAIADNVSMAFEAYDAWDKDGRFTRTVEGAGERGSTINESFRRFNRLVDWAGNVPTIRKFMLTPRSVREIEDSLEVSLSGENRDAVVYGGAVLGPKIGGGFLPNLNGHYDALTIDRWLARTYNRMTGNMLNGRGELQNGPRSGSERQFLRDAFESAVEQMSNQGYTVQQADLQALLWYPEKDLYQLYGVSDVRAAPTDYAVEVKKYVEKALSQGRKRDAAGRSESARRRAAPDGQSAAEQGTLFSAEERPRFSQEFDFDEYDQDIADPYVLDLTADEIVGPKIVPDEAYRYAARRWLQMAQDKSMFARGISEEKDLENIAWDLAKLRTSAWRPANAIERVDRAQRVATIQLPGKDAPKAMVLRDKNRVWVNVVDLRKGAQEGSAIYPIVANFAYNNGLRFIGDPAGLSADAVFRRTEQMLASALKFGTTKHLEPHEKQLKAGLAWRDGDHEYNIASMLAWSHDHVIDAVPTLQELSFDPKTGDILDADGNKVDRAGLDALLDVAGGREARAGSRTAARTVATGEFLTEYERGARDVPEGAELPEGLRKVSYSAELTDKKTGKAIEVGDIVNTINGKEVEVLEIDAAGDRVRLSGFAGGIWRPASTIGATFGDDEPKFSSETPEWIANGPAALQAAAGKINTYAPQQPIREKVQALTADWKKRLVQGMIDAYAPLKNLDMNAYISARMVKSADGVVEGMLMYGKPVMDADGAISGDLDGKGFLGTMQELKGEHDRFFMWLAGNRAERLAGEGRENLFTADEIAAMKALNQGEMADGSSREAAYLKAFKDFTSYNKSVMDIAAKTGLIDEESRHLWEHDFYVPFYRIKNDDTISGPTKIKGLVRQQAFKQLKGGKENLGDLMENTLRNWSHLLSASLANQAAAKSLLAAERVGVALEAKESAAQEMAKSMGKKGGAVYFMDQGRERWFVVDDPYVLQAISALEPTGMGGALKLMSQFKKMLTMGITISPAFKVRNLIRDSLAAPGQNEMSYNILGNIAEGWSGTDKKNADFAQMMFGGALMRFGTYLDGDNAEHVKRLIANGVDDETILTSQDKVKNALSALWDRWQEFGDRMENVNRAALYKQLRAAGKSHLEASYQARDMMDFSLQGSWAAMRVLTGVVPFLNARVQGLYKLGRAAQEDPKRLAYVVGAVAMTSIALMLAYQDDDDWKQREDWDRDNFWWFKIGNTAYRIPKPFEIGALGTIAERSVELIVSDEMTGKRFAQRMKQMVLDTFSMNPVPQLFKPMIDIYANKDSFTGRDIETQGMERHSKAERIGPNTTALARALGQAGEYTGLSPVQIDFLVRAYGGWLGTQAMTTVDVMAAPFATSARPASKWDDFTGGLVKEMPADSSRYLQNFYDQSKAIKEVMADIKLAREAGDLEKARALGEDNAEKVMKAKMYGQAERAIAKINTQMRQVRNDVNLSAQEKADRLEALTQRRNAMAKAVSERELRASAALQ